MPDTVCHRHATLPEAYGGRGSSVSPSRRAWIKEAAPGTARGARCRGRPWSC